jgi:hypothetical protein
MRATRDQIEAIKRDVAIHENLGKAISRYKKSKKNKMGRDPISNDAVCKAICPILTEELGG